MSDTNFTVQSSKLLHGERHRISGRIKEGATGEAVAHYQTLNELRNSCSSGCHLCSIFLSTLHSPVVSKDRNYPNGRSDDIEPTKILEGPFKITILYVFVVLGNLVV